MKVDDVKTSKINIKRRKEIRCILCDRTISTANFYRSYSVMAYNNRDTQLIPRQWACKRCLGDMYDVMTEDLGDSKLAIRGICQLMDIIFDSKVYDGAVKESEKNGASIFGNYMKSINSMSRFKDKVFFDSTSLDFVPTSVTSVFQHADKWTQEEKEQRDEVISMLGYDPFPDMNPDDRKSMYRDLLGLMDESMAKDLIKSKACIEVVRSYNRIDKIQKSIDELSSDSNTLTSNSSEIKQLLDLKTKESTIISNLSKDHGFAERYALGKSRGDGTLSGVLRRMTDEHFSDSFINIYDIETLGGMKQASDINAESIFKQLNLSENEYITMIKDLRESVMSKDKSISRLEEENRKIKVEIKKYHLEEKLKEELQLKNEQVLEL